jgi:hypothetical protein
MAVMPVYVVRLGEGSGCPVAVCGPADTVSEAKEMPCNPPADLRAFIEARYGAIRTDLQQVESVAFDVTITWPPEPTPE